jgi:hypothetical protein
LTPQPSDSLHEGGSERSIKQEIDLGPSTFQFVADFRLIAKELGRNDQNFFSIQ